ncbi:glutamine-hydrolyzing GMP synthase [endosymbiont of Ridgeia piscesae]|jgi:GMP synthase (glutamine-hydrolysing)|uniref:GMP synthase [glutamine-hydrolyzing] n=1 Tax=endosymbiont of Ridgeia piscesae TaxID=54398 RepID=A0A0T5ZBD6_9GAMM|nr:glutamine-hydrolyzing GMP synthase [endosymbiont of Ridgeia piscesae]KRT53615.1 GMP synthase (glutamine-hydrolyzing) [endosymbiont of Ridgeia piscesae]KRT60175.1 GMP synthase (glutamine-hydrolysing) [endosymbiont of Ridgeia piscesae]KRT60176.1 GMP synthase (glutamine-hydrolyzing) [endosymbiont of Ridgeia piscesae]
MTTDIHAHRILILDFGSQYTQLIARRVRESGVYCEIFPYDNAGMGLEHKPSGVILSGGPETVTADEAPRAPQQVFELGVPVLGICYGMQTMAAQLGGKVAASDKHEYGYAQVRARGHSKLLKDIEDHTNEQGYGLLDVWMSHGDRVEVLPPGFHVICETDNAPLAGMADEERGFYGIQFHPEVTHTRQGKRILDHFLFQICGCEALWTPGQIIEESITQVREQVGDAQVVLGLSGGVDSSVVAALLHRAIGDQLTCVFVDNGLLRLHEGDQVMATFAEHMGVRVIRVDAEDRFLKALKGVSDPEQKRKIIGNLFIDIFEEEASRLEDVAFLAQGTIYPDVIESAGAASGKAHVIKSHHNVGGLPDYMKLKLVEPLRELFKDEVRKIGVELGLPSEMIYRHPFPGPGLGVRILGEVKKAYADILRQADHIYIEELRKHNLYDEVSQAFAVFLPVKSVGVVGDARRYEYVVSLRAVKTIDFMTASFAHLPFDFLEEVSRRIINEVAGISRVAYDISSKPPATIEWE